MKKLLISMIVIVVLFTGCNQKKAAESSTSVQPSATVQAAPAPVNPGKVLQLDSLVTVATEHAPAAQCGVEQNPPGGGGAAFWVSNTIVTGESRNEIIFKCSPIDATPYKWLVFDIMGDTNYLIENFHGIYPRFRSSGVHTQFEGNFFLRDAIEKQLTAGEPQKWITIGVPIETYALHENHSNYQSVMSSADEILIRLITSNDPYPGRLYFKNIRLTENH